MKTREYAEEKPRRRCKEISPGIEERVQLFNVLHAVNQQGEN